MSEWTIEPGTDTTRALVAETYGGSTMGGIQPSRTTANVLVYSDPTVGHAHGYHFDGWGPDGAYYYTGEGQSGNQTITKGNRAIAESSETGKTLRLFEAASGRRPGGKLQRYVGAFHLDEMNPYRYEPVTAADGSSRQVVVFRLWPDDGAPHDRAVLADPAPLPGPSTEFVPPESNLVREFEVAARAAGKARRVEAELMANLEEHLRAQGHEVGRCRITLPVEGRWLLTDTFDATTGTLYEAKQRADRAAVRMAVGQLFDYRRHVTGVQRCVVLLPERPSEDLVELIASVGFELSYPSGDSFVMERTGAGA